MKCPKCGGNAELSNWGSIIDIDYADYHVECEKCGYHSMGSTEPLKAKEMFRKQMGMYYTNEEWLCNLSTEEKAKFLRQIYRDGRDDYVGEWYEQTEKDFDEWLKQPHTTIKE